MLHSQLREGRQPTVSGEISAQGIEDRRTPFLMTSQLSLLLGPDGQPADRQRHDQHDGKREEILKVRHGKG